MEATNWFKACGKKNRYKTKKFAKQVAKSVKKRRSKPIAIYKCNYCGGYHLTSRVKKEVRGGSRQ